MNKRWQRFGTFFLTALLVVTQLQPVLAGSRGQKKPLPSDNEKPATDLTGTWIGDGDLVTIDRRGCTAGYSGNVSINGREPQHQAFTVKQSGHQLLLPTVATTWGSGSNSGSGTQSSQGTVSGDTVTITLTANGAGFTIEYTGKISPDGNTVTGKGICKTPRGPATANVNFKWTRKVSLAQCSRFQTMLGEAKNLQKLADTLKKDDKAYHTAVVDIILRGYSAPYAVYMLDVPSEEIPEYFKDEQQIQAVRSQIINRISTKADNRKRFAEFGQSGNFHTNGDVYSKENIELFCTLDSSKFTKEFWDSLWMAGYIDYELHTQVENQLIWNNYQNYFDILVQIASLIPQTRVFKYIYQYKGKEYLFTKPELSAVERLKSEKLPEVTTTTEEDINQGILLSPKRQKHILDGDTDANGDITGGGHGSGRNVPGKSQFPSSWSDEKTIQNIKDVVSDPNSKWKQITGKTGARYTKKGKPVRYQFDGTRDSVNITVIIEPDGEGIITAFPANIPPNP